MWVHGFVFFGHGDDDGGIDDVGVYGDDGRDDDNDDDDEE